VLAAIAKAYLVVTKDFLREAGQRSTQEILMVSGKGLKRLFLTVYLTKKRTNGTSVCGSALDATNLSGNAREKHGKT
jgi:hypothetical protein